MAAGTASAFPDAVNVINWPLLIGASVVMALPPGANQLLSLFNGFRVGVIPSNDGSVWALCRVCVDGGRCGGMVDAGDAACLLMRLAQA